jgi:hypothetical protein
MSLLTLVVCSPNARVNRPKAEIAKDSLSSKIIVFNFHTGGPRYVFDFDDMTYNEYFKNGQLRKTGSMAFKSDTLTSDRLITTDFVSVVNQICPIGNWTYYNSDGSIRYSGGLECYIEMVRDSCHLGNGFWEIFYVNDFMIKR